MLFWSENNHEGHIINKRKAFHDEHEKIKKAKVLGLTFYKYHEFLGEWINQFTSIAVTGSHGKTSTTGLLAHVLEQSFPTSFLMGFGTGKGQLTIKFCAFEAAEINQHFYHINTDNP